MDPPPKAEYTTNAHDQAEAAKLKVRLSEGQKLKHLDQHEFHPVQAVKIASGAHKYVLISAEEPRSSETKYFVTSRKGAHYHRNAAEPFVHDLEKHGYNNIQVTGGGRIQLDEAKKRIAIFGFSYTFGLADHEISRQVVQADERYADFEITTSNEGY